MFKYALGAGIRSGNRPLGLARQRRPWLYLALLVLVPGGPVGAEPDPDPLVVGVFPRRAPAVTERLFEPLARYLEGHLGRPVRLETTHDFVSFWNAVESKSYDLVHYNQYHYVRSHAEYGYRVILSNEEFGRSKIAGAIVVRKDSGIAQVSDLEHRKVVFGGGRKAMIAHIAVRYLLQQAGLEKGDYLGQFALTPPKACVAVYYRQAAAGGVGDPVLDMPGVQGQVSVSELRYLAKTRPLAHLPWAVAPHVDPSQAKRIQEALAEADKSRQGRSMLGKAQLTGLRRAVDAEYDVHRRIIHEVLGEAY